MASPAFCAVSRVETPGIARNTSPASTMPKVSMSLRSAMLMPAGIEYTASLFALSPGAAFGSTFLTSGGVSTTFGGAALRGALALAFFGVFASTLSGGSVVCANPATEIASATAAHPSASNPLPTSGRPPAAVRPRRRCRCPIAPPRGQPPSR